MTLSYVANNKPASAVSYVFSIAIKIADAGRNCVKTPSVTRFPKVCTVHPKSQRPTLYLPAPPKQGVLFSKSTKIAFVPHTHLAYRKKLNFDVYLF